MTLLTVAKRAPFLWWLRWTSRPHLELTFHAHGKKLYARLQNWGTGGNLVCRLETSILRWPTTDGSAENYEIRQDLVSAAKPPYVPKGDQLDCLVCSWWESPAGRDIRVVFPSPHTPITKRVAFLSPSLQAAIHIRVYAFTVPEGAPSTVSATALLDRSGWQPTTADGWNISLGGGRVGSRE
jgi:hypothetical protein